jgi:ABC-type metal ion transport system substrate-binding protein
VADGLLWADEAGRSRPAEKKSIKVGVTAEPHAEIMAVVKRSPQGRLEFQIVEFSDI